MLSKKQRDAIQLLIYTDKKDVEIIEELQLGCATLWRWKQQDEFREELEKENRRKFKSLQTQALHAMAKLINEGHFQAAKYILDGNDYAPTEKHELDMTANITVDYGDDDEG